MLKITKALEDIRDELNRLDEELLSNVFPDYREEKISKLLKIKDLYNEILELEFTYGEKYTNKHSIE